MRNRMDAPLKALRTVWNVFFLLGVYSACLAQVTLNQNGHVPTSIKVTKGGRNWVEQTLKRLTLEEKVGQMLQIRCYPDYKDFDSYEYRHLRDQLRKYHIGSVVVGMHFNHSGPLRALPLEAATVANELQKDSDLPLLIAADVERGVASRLSDVASFPWPMAFGAVDDPREVEQFAAITGREARAVGIQWALAPVADLNSNPENPVINTRSFGEDSVRVSSLVAAYIKGAHSAGLLVTAKHFPGNGDTTTDSHHAVAIIGSDMAHLQKFEFQPFESAIAAGVDSIMLAHARVPALEQDPTLITTISRKVVNGTLKDRLHFKGVVLTDALEMRGMTQIYDAKGGSPTARAAVDAVKAGNDVIMLPSDLDGAFHAIVEAVRRKEISESRINESVRKILEMKAEVGLNESRFVDLDQVGPMTVNPEDAAFAQHIADEAITLVRNNGKVLPLREVQSVNIGISQAAATNENGRGPVVIILGDALERANGRDFEKSFRTRSPDATFFRLDHRNVGGSIPNVLKAVTDADKIIVAAYVIHGASRQMLVDGKYVPSFGLTGWSGKLLEQVLAVAPDRTAVIALGSPYLIEGFPQIQTYLCAYAMTPTSEISAVKAIFGELEKGGHLPVTLPAVAKRGFSLPLPRL